MKPSLELIKSLLLPDFPSGSSINFYQGSLYIIGDDANDILVLDSLYNQQSLIHLFDYPEKRIHKVEKPDFETSTIVNLGGEHYLLVLGSASRPNRTKGVLLPLKEKTIAKSQIIAVDYQQFVNRLEAIDPVEINIEGSTVIGNQFMLGNRANRMNPVNKLITTEVDFWKDQFNASIRVSSLKLSTKQDEIIGVSELCYVPSRDRLLMILSTEGTDSSYEDGAIGDSYLGWINEISSKIGRSVIELDCLINLSERSNVFKGEKIEGLCVEMIANNEMTLHFVSDNDRGESTVFKVKALL